MSKFEGGFTQEEFDKIAEEINLMFDEAEESKNPSPTATVGGREDDNTKAKKKTLNLSQYAQHGDSYLATTSTVKTLPADAYKLVSTQQGLFFKAQKLVTDNLIKLPDSKAEAVIAEVDKFWDLKPVFKKFGFAHKRGFLLHGNPGSGKTSAVSIIIKEMISRGGIVFIADHPYALGEALSNFRDVELERPLVVIWEDIDAVVKNFGESKVLAILDGESQVENIVFIATTNYPEDLDGRLTNRPSRFDKVVEIPMPNAAARETYLKFKLDTTTYIDKSSKVYDLVKETNGFSVAHIKELIVGVYCQDTPIDEVLERLRKMKVTPKSTPSSRMQGLMGLRED